MHADLISVTTPEGIPLSGAYFAGSGNGRANADAMVFLHGDGGHFYAPLNLGLGEFIAASGVAFLAANRRGHDLVSHGAKGGPLAGYAFESVADSRVDFRSWLDCLVERGHKRIVIGGHSGGAVRSVYAQAMEHYDEVVGVVAVSPGEYHHETVAGLHGDDFVVAFEQAERDVARGRPETLSVPGVPWGSMWSAGAYVDCFNQDNRYSVSAHAAGTGCPTLFVFGAAECSGPETLPVCGTARDRLEAARLPNAEVRVIDGANHGYQDRERVFYQDISAWLEANIEARS